MKKIFKILIILIFVVVGLIWWIGSETKYSYIENDLYSQNVEIINNSDFNLSLSCSPEMNDKKDSPNGLGVQLIFKQIREDVQIDSVIVNVTSKLNDQTLELSSVNAVDGYYSWKKEYNSQAESFEQLPDKFKTIKKDIKAYFVYSWYYDKLRKNENVDLIKVTTKINLSSNGEKYNILKENIFKLKSELIYRNPIRFH